MTEEEDFLERHADAIENALLKKQIEELHAKIDIQQMLTTMKPFPHSGEWIRETTPDGMLKLSYPPDRGYEDDKDEALRMLDNDQWTLSLWEAKHHFQNRRLAILYFTIAIVGFCAIHSTWMRFLMSVGMLIVLHGYLWSYGYRIEVPIARLRSHIRSRFQNKGGRKARHGGLKA